MSTILEQKAFVKAIRISTTGDGIQFFHDYGEKTFPWGSLSHFFAIFLEKKKIRDLPLIIFLEKNSPTFYYIDINTAIDDASGGAPSSHKAQYHSFPEALKSKEEDLRRILKEICHRITSAYIDKSLVGFIKGSSAFVPVFAKLRDIATYCKRIMETLTEKDFVGAQVLESRDELPKITLSRKEREEWKAGSVIEGSYTVQQILRGGMGTVYIVFDSSQVKSYAMKTFQEKHVWDEKIIKQFINEAEIWIRLGRHPNIVQAELVKEIEGKHYIFLEYIQGTDLQELLSSERLTVAKALEFSIQFCSGMDYAFRKLGLIHRDIKPSNCLIRRDGILKITDFGLGKIFEQSSPEGNLMATARDRGKDKSAPSSSSSSAMMGTVAYMAPEFFSEGGGASIQSDIYAFGIILYEMLTGIHPFISSDVMELIDNHLSLQPPEPDTHNQDVPRTLSKLVMKCLDKDKEYRYKSYEEIRTELEEIYRELTGAQYEQIDIDETLSEDDWINQGMSLASLGRHSEAIITFDQALHINPHSLNAVICRAASLIELGKNEEALSYLNSAMKINPRDWRVWLYGGEALWKSGHRSKALSCFDRGLALAEDQAPLLGRKAQLLAETGKFDEALQIYDLALNREPRSTEIWDGKAELLIQLNRYEEALTCIRHALEINPRFERGWYNQGIALFNLGMFSSAITALKTTLNLNPTLIDAWLYIGNCYRESGDRRNALESYQSTLELSPENVDAHCACILLLREEGKWEEALSSSRSALEVAPGNAEILFLRAEILFTLGYFEECLDLCRDIEIKAGRHENAQLLFDITLKLMKEQSKIFEKIDSEVPLTKEFCLKDLNRLLTVFCDTQDALRFLETCRNEARAEYLKACLFFVEGNREMYAVHLEKALKAPQTGESALKKKKLFEKLDRSESFQHQKQGLLGSLFRKKETEQETADAEEFLLAGLEKLNQDMFKEARECFRSALTLDPGMTSAGFFMGKSYEREGNLERAGLLYNEFISNSPDSPGFWKITAASRGKAESEHLENAFCKLIGSFPEYYHSWISYLLHLCEHKYYVKAMLIASHLLANYDTRLDLGKEEVLFWNIKGLLQLLLERYDGATESFSRALTLDARNLTSLSGMVKSLGATGKYREASPFLDAMRNLDNEKGIYGYFMSELNAKRGDLRKSLAFIEDALAVNKNSLLLLYQKARTLLSLERDDEFFTLYNEICSLDAQYNPVKVLRSQVLVTHDQPLDAIYDLNEIIQNDSLNIVAHKNQGFVYLLSNNPQKAIKSFELISSRYALDYQTFLGLGIAHYELGDHHKALQHFTEAARLNSIDPDLWQFMGAVNFFLGNNEASEMCWNRALRYRSGFMEAWINKGNFLYLRENFDEAMELANRALRINPEEISAWILRAQCQRRKGDLQNGIRSVERAITSSPDSIKGWTVRGILEFYSKKYELSFQSFEKASALESKNAEIWYNKALLAMYLRNQSEVRKALDRALALNPALFEALIARAAMEMQSQSEGVAGSFTVKAQQADPRKFETWSQAYQAARNPLASLSPLEITADPFTLPLKRPLALLEPLEFLHYLDMENHFTGQEPLIIVA